MLWFSAKYLAGDIYLNAFILGVAELPGKSTHIGEIRKHLREKHHHYNFLTTIKINAIYNNYDSRYMRFIVHTIHNVNNHDSK